MIPLNFKDYYKKFQELTDKGTINTKNQIASPLSAGSRGLAKLEKFADSPNQIMRGSVTESADREYQKLDKDTIEKLRILEESSSMEIHKYVELYNSKI